MRDEKSGAGAAPPHYYLACFLHACMLLNCCLLYYVPSLLRDDNYEWHLQVPWELDCYFLIWRHRMWQFSKCQLGNNEDSINREKWGENCTTRNVSSSSIIACCLSLLLNGISDLTATHRVKKYFHFSLQIGGPVTYCVYTKLYGCNVAIKTLVE